MPVPSGMKDLSTTASSNSPAGSENPISTDDFLRAIQAIVRTTNAKGADIASASSIDLGAATGEFVDVTGTTTITSLGTVVAGINRTVRFTGALTLTHNATSLILPSSANITTANGDVAQFRSLGSGNWKCTGYVKQDGTALVAPSLTGYVTETGAQTLTNKTLTSPVITASTATVATDDKVLLLDISDSDLTKTVTASAVSGLLAVGENQSWTVVTGSRALATNYTNSTGKPIQVLITVATNSTSNVALLVGGVTLASTYINTASGSASPISAIIPNGAVYRVNSTGGSPSISIWAELR
jgi:hypothetical protein